MLTQTKSLFISAGHSARDPGAVGNGHTEADIVLAFRDAVCDELDAKGIKYQRDGQKGENLPLRKAVQLASQHDVAVEFHCNAFHAPTATGVETLSADSDRPLGEALCEAISDTLTIANRGAKAEGSGQHSRLAFVSDGGGIIVELFFLTNPQDLAAYRQHRRALVSAIARVLVDAITDEYDNWEDGT